MQVSLGLSQRKENWPVRLCRQPSRHRHLLPTTLPLVQVSLGLSLTQVPPLRNVPRGQTQPVRVLLAMNGRVQTMRLTQVSPLRNVCGGQTSMAAGTENNPQ